MQRLAAIRRAQSHHDDHGHQEHAAPPPRDYKALWKTAVQKIREQKMQNHLHHNSNKGRVFLLLGNFAFVILFYVIICRTIPISDLAETTGGINAFMNKMVTYTKADGSDGNLGNVATLDDVVNYIEALVKILLTGKGYRGARQPDEELMLLRVHRLLNTIVLTQRRVAPSDCSYRKMRPIYEVCYEGLDSGYEITKGTQKLNNGVEVPYNENMSGFGVPLQLDQDTALEEIKELREGMFWDRATREATVLFAFHNSPGHYTGSVGVTFTLSPYGVVGHSLDSQFLRMRPYSPEVNGASFLVLQLIGVFCFLCMLGWYIYGIVRQPHIRWSLAKFLAPWNVVEMMLLIMMMMVIYFWFSYLNDPIRTSFDFESDKYQNVRPLAAKFGELIFLMAAVLLILTVRMIEFFAEIENPQIQKMSRLVEAVIGSLSYFMAIFALAFVGFVLTAHVLFGPVEPQFDGIGHSSKTLSLWFVTLGSGQRSLMEMNGGTFFVVFFVMLMIVLFFNMFIVIVMAAYDEVMNAEPDPWQQPFNFWLADVICDALGVRKFNHDPYHKVDFENFEYDQFASAVRRAAAARRAEAAESAQQPASASTSSNV